MSKLIENGSNRKDTVTLYEEYRLIERDYSDISKAWRGVHLLLFFLAFVFGSFCTFCFHMLMYLFDDKCVLFPKLISLKEMGSKSDFQNGKMDKGTSKQLIYDYIPDSNMDSLPVDFVATHWVEKKTCYLPTYTPLLSAICGLIWTTMFLMCSADSRTLTRLQKAWRTLPTVFVFSMVMSGISVYTTYITQTGLDELCHKLAEISGTNTCSYTINVATLAYERRIRGVYQATRLTIMSAWLHTLCWIGSALTALFRVILVVDFRLVKVQVDLQGNIEKMLERHEKHIRTDEFSNKDEQNSPRRVSAASLKVRFVNKGFGTESNSNADTLKAVKSTEAEHYVSQASPYSSEMSLTPGEFRKMSIRKVSANFSTKYRFLVELLNGIVDNIDLEPKPEGTFLSESDVTLNRQLGLRNFVWSSSSNSETESILNREEAEQLAKKFRHVLQRKATIRDFKRLMASEPSESLLLNLNSSNKGVQTDEDNKETALEIEQISNPKPSVLTLKPSKTTIDKQGPTETLEIEENRSTTDTLKPRDEVEWRERHEESKRGLTDDEILHKVMENKMIVPEFLASVVKSFIHDDADTPFHIGTPKVEAAQAKITDDATEKKNIDKTSDNQPPSDIKEEISQEAGPSQTKEEQEEKDIKREKPKKTDTKEKID